jgi:predicted SnoaL-like aldol condensation-catalyzing enzyme
MDAKELVREYYEKGAYKDAKVMQSFIHDDLLLQWHSSKGFLQLEKNDLVALVSEMQKSYSDARVEISHIIAEGNSVCVRYTHYVHAFENPAEETILAHFILVWEIKDNKLYKGFLMSQLG